MAAVSVNSREDNINGHTREIVYQVDIAADGDTLQTGLTSIIGATATSQTAGAGNIIGVTKSATRGEVIFQTAGAETDALVVIRGF